MNSPSSSAVVAREESDASLFGFANPLPIALFPHIILEGCQLPPPPKAWERDVDCELRSSLLCLAGATPKSPPKRARAAFVMAPDGLLVAVDMGLSGEKERCVYGKEEGFGARYVW